MAKNFMAYPELRHPFEQTPVHGADERTVLYQGRTIRLENVGPGNGLLVSAADLTRINGFVLKPEGACFGDLCIPLPEGILSEISGQTWFDLAAFADHLQQPFVADAEAGVWSFGEIPDKRSRTLTEALAPEVEITDRAGNVFNLADLKGRKALIVTWSSW